jgi:hypothetical protein
LLKVYKAYNPDIPWQSDIMIKSIEPYFFTKGILREEVYSRFIKPTAEAYLGNVRLLTRPPRVVLLSKHVYNGSEGPTLSKALKL